MATEIKITNKVKELARDYDIDILKKQVKDLTDRVDKLEAQFTFNLNLDSDFNYIKEHQWDESPFEWTNYTQDTSVSKRPL